MSKYQFLDEFYQESNRMVITDPGYKLDDIKKLGLGIILENAMVGKWYIWIKPYNGRCQELVAIYGADADNAEVEYLLNDDENWEEFVENISVDSGQTGIYDLDYYNRDDLVEEFNKENNTKCENWYDMNCYCTEDSHAGIFDYGVVTSSGYGDGMYPAYCIKNDDNLVCGIKIVFIEDGEEFECVPPYYLK